MHCELKKLSDTKAKLTITSTEEDLIPIKNSVLTRLSADIKVPGFRQGKVPISVAEKNINKTLLDNEFIEEALTNLYSKAVKTTKIRPANQPAVSIKKFVPYTALDFDVEVEAVMEIKLPDYKKIKLERPKVEVTANDINDVIDRLKIQAAEKKEVNRAAKNTDEVWIDFKGNDEKGVAVPGADGKDYPLVLGSKTFIPGFEENLVGLKKGDEKSFDVTFPKDYGVKSLQSKKVKFSVKVNKINGVSKPELDDKFAAKVGPFKTLKELKDDIKKQLSLEREKHNEEQYSSDLVEKISSDSKIAVPKTMIDQQVEHNLTNFKRDLTYRGQTYDEFLKSESTTDEKYRSDVVAPQAEKQIKAGLVLAQISEEEKIMITPEELEIRLQLLKSQYQDPKMQAELDKPESRNDIASRMITEKVLEKIKTYASS